jgi:DNA-binding CsgD family transcriptional regulator
MGFAQNSIVTSIYDMALRRSNWDVVLDLMTGALPGCLLLLRVDDMVTGGNLAFASRGLSPDGISQFINHFAELNPFVARQAEIAPLLVFQDDQLLSRKESGDSSFVRDWLDKQGDFGAATGMVLLREGTRQLVLEVRYAERAGAELRDRVTNCLNELSGHFQRAFEISRRARFSNSPGYLDGVVDDLPFAIFFVNAEMQIQYCNANADALRRTAGGPFKTADGVLRAADPEADAALRRAVTRAIATRRSPSSALQILPKQGEEHYFATVRPAARTGYQGQLHDVVLEPSPLVMLILHGSREAASLPSDLLWRAFSFSDAEASLAEALLAGDTLADYARFKAVSKQTLRNQLVGVMRKTGTNRQAELISLLTRLSLTCL